MAPEYETLTLEDLDRVHGGMRWQDLPMSTNIEDRRPQSDGGPVPDAEWQKEQDGYNNSCWIGADGQQYEGDPSGGPAQPMDFGGDDGGADYGGDGGGGDGGY